MAAKWIAAMLVTATAALAGGPVALAQYIETVPMGHAQFPPYMPQGHTYMPGDDDLPPVNSAQSQFQTRVDILQTEIYRRQYETRLFESEMHRHDLGVGPLEGPRY